MFLSSGFCWLQAHELPKSLQVHVWIFQIIRGINIKQWEHLSIAFDVPREDKVSLLGVLVSCSACYNKEQCGRSWFCFHRCWYKDLTLLSDKYDHMFISRIETAGLEKFHCPLALQHAYCEHIWRSPLFCYWIESSLRSLFLCWEHSMKLTLAIGEIPFCSVIGFPYWQHCSGTTDCSLGRRIANADGVAYPLQGVATLFFSMSYALLDYLVLSASLGLLWEIQPRLLGFQFFKTSLSVFDGWRKISGEKKSFQPSNSHKLSFQQCQ